jgi:hypothetical protein
MKGHFSPRHFAVELSGPRLGTFARRVVMPDVRPPTTDPASAYVPTCICNIHILISSGMPLLDRLLASGLLLLHFGLLPTGIGIVFLHRFRENIGLLAEILLIHHPVAADDKSHDAG